MACDPLEIKYPTVAPYIAFNNSPNIFIDIRGGDIVIYLTTLDGQNKQKALIIKTDKINTEISIPLNLKSPVIGVPLVNIKEPYVIDLDELLKTDFDYDAFMVSYGFTIAAFGGVTASIDLVYIFDTDSPDKNTLNVYGSMGGGAGWDASLSRSQGFVNFNEKSGKKHTMETYEGWAQITNAGVGAFGGGVSASQVVSYTDGGSCFIPFSNCGKTKLYSATLVGGGLAASPGTISGGGYVVNSTQWGTFNVGKFLSGASGGSGKHKSGNDEDIRRLYGAGNERDEKSVCAGKY